METLFSTLWRGLFGRSGITFTRDPLREEIEDVVIVVIGPTGSGKSTLINAIVGGEVAPVGHGLSTCTKQVEAYRFHLPPDFEVCPGGTVVLVDTPGFDDTAMHDSTRVFKGVAQWIAAEYPNKQKTSSVGKRSPPRIAGFVYLQDISQKRINNRQHTDFCRLQQLLGEVGSHSSHSELLLVTYQWPSKPPESLSPSPSSAPAADITTAAASRGSASQSLLYQEAEEREKELRDDFWKDLLEKGARMLRVEREPRTVVLEVLKPTLNRVKAKKRRTLVTLRGNVNRAYSGQGQSAVSQS